MGQMEVLAGLPEQSRNRQLHPRPARQFCGEPVGIGIGLEKFSVFCFRVFFFALLRFVSVHNEQK